MSDCNGKEDIVVEMEDVSRVAVTSFDEDLRKILELERRECWFRRKKLVTPEDLLVWNPKTPILPKPLTKIVSSQLRRLKEPYSEMVEIITNVVLHEKTANIGSQIQRLGTFGVFTASGVLRDEIYLQCLRLLIKNPDNDMVYRILKLLTCISAIFPPSKLLIRYVQHIVGFEVHNDNVSRKLKEICTANLFVFDVIGPRGYVPPEEDIETAYSRAGQQRMLFGVDLDEIMTDSEETVTWRSLKIPRILEFLIESIRKLGGFHYEGIFRRPGDVGQVFHLKHVLSFDNYTLPSLKDPSVPASLLKMWIRVLKSPLIPDSLYEKCLLVCQDPDDCVKIFRDELRANNRAVLLRIFDLMLEMSKSEYTTDTKMNLDNLIITLTPCLFRCPMTDQMTILAKSFQEREFIRSLLSQLNSF